jgi:hypothetical protein
MKMRYYYYSENHLPLGNVISDAESTLAPELLDSLFSLEQKIQHSQGCLLLHTEKLDSIDNFLQIRDAGIALIILLSNDLSEVELRQLQTKGIFDLFFKFPVTAEQVTQAVTLISPHTNNAWSLPAMQPLSEPVSLSVENDTELNIDSLLGDTQLNIEVPKEDFPELSLNTILNNDKIKVPAVDATVVLPQTEAQEDPKVILQRQKGRIVELEQEVLSYKMSNSEALSGPSGRSHFREEMLEEKISLMHVDFSMQLQVREKKIMELKRRLDLFLKDQQTQQEKEQLLHEKCKMLEKKIEEMRHSIQAIVEQPDIKPLEQHQKNRSHQGVS